VDGAYIWIGKIFDEKGVGKYIDAISKVQIKGQVVEMGLTMSIDGSYGMSLSKIKIKEGSKCEDYFLNLMCGKTVK
jgi:hypothetical protein